MKKLIKKLVPNKIINAYRDYKRQEAYKNQIEVYRGNSVVCPICNSTFKQFAPFGLVKRENAKCHVCGSLERHRLMWKYLREKTGIFNDNKKIRLLHFAPERSFYDAFSKNKHVDYVPCDLFPEVYSYNGNVKIEKVDILDIPFDEGNFDVILCNHVLEHIPDDRKAMSELYRVMKNGGWGIFQVPLRYEREETYEDFTIVTPKDRVRAFGQKDHVRWYGRDYKDRLKGVGFNVKQDDYVKTFTSEELFKFGLIPSELIYFCSK